MSNVFTAFHDKNKDKTSLYDNHAVIVDQQFEPFLVTQFDLFFVSLPELTTRIQQHQSIQKFNSHKRITASTLLILAVPLALLYILHFFSLLPLELPALALVLIKQEIFLAALALLILWHDLATNYDAPKQLPYYPELDDYLKATIEQQGVQFQHYLIQNPLDYFHPTTFDFLVAGIVRTNNGSYLDSSRLLKGVLRHAHIQNILKKLEIPALTDRLATALTQEASPTYHYTALQSFILYAMEQAIVTRSRKVYPEHVLLALFSVFPILQQVLLEYRVDFLTFTKTVEHYLIEEQYQARVNAFDISIPYYRKGGVADGWVKGFTFYLDKISFNVLEQITQRGGLYGIGHTKEINTLLGILQKEYNANTILVGDPGVGKSSVIYGLAQRILDGDVPPNLKNISIKSIDLNKFLSLAQSGAGGLPELVAKLSDELRKQVGTILYFDDLEVLLSTGTGEGTAMSYLMPLLTESPVPIIGTMTFAQYTRLKQNFPTVIDAFKEVRVDQVSQEDTLTILMSKISQLERYHRITISIPALRDIITLTATYLPNKRFPKKAVELLEQAAAVAANTKEKVLSRDLVSQTIQSLADIPIAQASPEEAEKLLTLEKRIHQTYINQHDAVLAIVDALQRAKTNVRDTSKPFGVFLFLGPSGVGKTELAKITAQEYFGAEYALIRVDLSQYKLDSDINTIISLLKKVTLRPYCLLLLDEFEKTTTVIQDMFMRLFDEGIVITPEDETLYFNNSIIIATSNIGSNLLVTATPEQFTEARQGVLDLLHQSIKIELLNRFDKIIVFSALSLDHLQQITVLMLNQLVEKLQEQGIKAQYSDRTIAYIVSRGYSPGMGARPLRRVIQDTLESALAKSILQSQQQTGRNPSSVHFDELLPQMPLPPQEAKTVDTIEN